MTDAEKQKLRENLREKKMRRSYSMHDCCLCGKLINATEQYYDGGINKRAHRECVEGIQH